MRVRGQVSGALEGLVNQNWFAWVDRALYPPVCLICGHAGRAGLDCCRGCGDDLPVWSRGCRRCALELTRGVARCGQCLQREPCFDRVWAGFAYREPIAGLIQRFKFQRDLAAGRVLAGLLAEQLACREVALPAALVPVPLHFRRRWWRGFNQAELLAGDLAALLGRLPLVPCLTRRRATQVQSGLPAGRRRGNVRGAFSVVARQNLPARVALIDDVMTTGSTLNECARVLKRAGVQTVDVWVVARA